ncbi:MAG TPA: hypothetical protein VEB66_09665 [Opitutaceae bacterium]|nr:hypothetical protein [Opitutaceae bacterium]
MAPPHGINTKDPAAVADAVRRVFASLGAQASHALIDRVFTDVTRLFWGQYPGYRAIDMFYHDFEHTLQATVCLVHILEGRHRAGAAPALTRRDLELALIAVLLHDSGYIKRTDDARGTGAKYTLVHVTRSCEFARTYLPPLGVEPGEIDDIANAIGCTGPVNKFNVMPFRRPEARLIACILVTADYLGQMSAADYVEELPVLFGEFTEAYEHENLPEDKRFFKNERQLIEKTPEFWERYVRPMLAGDAGAMYRFLDRPDGSNPYLEAVEANIAAVRRQIGSATPVA